MIIVLTGPGQVQKRKKLSDLKGKFPIDQVTILDLKSDSVEKLKVETRSVSLFSSGPRLLVVENSTDALDLGEVDLQDPNLTLILVGGSLKAEGKLLKSAKSLGASILQFEAEKEVSAFPFIDALLEKNTQAHILLKELLEEYGGVYVLTMIAYGLRRNFLPQNSQFIKQKIAKQKALFKQSDFIDLYRRVLQTEFQIKSGGSPEDIALTGLVEHFVLRR